MKIKALLVDDEPLARKRLRDLLKFENEISIIGEARNGMEAITAIKEKSPDLVFLDIQMPEMDGFDVIKTIGIEKMPHIIFITAYDQYALEAFDVNAIDYLLKPFSKKRFKNSLEKVIQYIGLKEKSKFTVQMNRLLAETGKKYVDRLIVKSGVNYSIIKTCEIDWIESSGNYLIIHVEKEKHIIRGTISKMAASLDPDEFIRIHRQSIVNIDRIKGFQHYFKGEYKIFLENGIQLTLGNVYREKFKEKFNDII